MYYLGERRLWCLFPTSITLTQKQIINTNKYQDFCKGGSKLTLSAVQQVRASCPTTGLNTWHPEVGSFYQWNQIKTHPKETKELSWCPNQCLSINHNRWTECSPNVWLWNQAIYNIDCYLCYNSGCTWETEELAANSGGASRRYKQQCMKTYLSIRLDCKHSKYLFPCKKIFCYYRIR